MTRVLGLAGWSGAGKTTLLTRLIPALREKGHSVSTLKHAHHSFDIDKPGKDSHRHREAGAGEVLIASGSRWALMHELRGRPSLAWVNCCTGFRRSTSSWSRASSAIRTSRSRSTGPPTASPGCIPTTPA